MNTQTTSQPIGRVIGTEKQPNTAYTFYFWGQAGPNRPPVGIGSLVKVVTEDEVVYGTIVQALGFNDLPGPLGAYLSSSGNPTKPASTLRPEVRMFEVAVLRREPEEPIGAVPMGTVYIADAADVRHALRSDSYYLTTGIPCGCYGSVDDLLPVHFDSDFLLGPEAGHLNITGTSGLATKTSYLLFLLNSIFQKYKDNVDLPGEKGAAALIFNTKGGDLLYVDQPPQKMTLSETEAALYDKLDLRPEPFEKVEFYAPRGKDLQSVGSVRNSPDLANPTRQFTFGLRDILQHVEILLGRDDIDAKSDGYLQFLLDAYVEKASPMLMEHGGADVQAHTLEKLVQVVTEHSKYCELHKGEEFHNHHASTISKMRRRLANLEKRFSGVIEASGDPKGPFASGYQFKDRTLVVVDVAQLGPQEQELVFAAAITKLRERMENQELGVSRLIVAVDELNKYAPSGAGDTYISTALRDIAARGRYMGLVLFGAQQFRSRVDREVVGNASTHAFGHIEVDELSQPGYGYLSKAIKEKLSTLERGTLLVKHPHFTQPIFVRFPRPFTMTGGEGMKRYPPTKVSIDQQICELIKSHPKFVELKDRVGRIKPSELHSVYYELQSTNDEDKRGQIIRNAPLATDALIAQPLSNGSLLVDDEDPFERKV